MELEIVTDPKLENARDRVVMCACFGTSQKGSAHGHLRESERLSTLCLTHASSAHALLELCGESSSVRGEGVRGSL